MKTINNFLLLSLVLSFMMVAPKLSIAQNTFPSFGNAGIGTATPNFENLLEAVGDSTSLKAISIYNNGYSYFRTYASNNVSFQGAIFLGSRSRGTISSPTNVVSGDRTSAYLASMYYNGAYRFPTSIDMYAGSTLSSTSYPGYMIFQTTSNGSTSRQERMRIAESGNVGIGTSSPSALLTVGSATCNGFTWTNSSDRNLKENIQKVDGESILDKVMQLEISQWNYKSKDALHIGPMSQDFYKIFQVGKDDKTISSIDPAGIALASIQELKKKTDMLTETIEAQQKIIAEQNKALKVLAKSLNSNIDFDSFNLDGGINRLYQNYPNPSNTDTNIKVHLSKQVKNAKLCIYNFEGRQIKEINLDKRGHIKATIDAGALNAGMYIYTLVIDGKANDMKRMILTD